VDVDADTDPIYIYTEPADLEGLPTSLDAAGVNVEEDESAMIAKQTVSLDSDHVRKALRMVDLLEDLDDVQRVTTNVDIPEDVLAALAG
jgi:transcriptional/translational regulatory protein YebC/TACO1